MKRNLLILVALFTICFSFNAFAKDGEKMNEFVPRTPQNEVKNEDRTLDDRWTWLSDDMCVQFRAGENWKLDAIQRRADSGMLSRWAEHGSDGSSWLKSRDTYSGKWLLDTNGVKSFAFDDMTIPVGPTNIDGVIYAFNTYGELKDGYNYYGELKTGPDGLVATDNPEFLEWLSTQYLPKCTSHE